MMAHRKSHPAKRRKLGHGRFAPGNDACTGSDGIPNENIPIKPAHLSAAASVEVNNVGSKNHPARSLVRAITKGKERKAPSSLTKAHPPAPAPAPQGDCISRLSLEILCRILSYLPLRDVVRAERACRRMRDAVTLHLRLVDTVDFTEGAIHAHMPAAFTDDTLQRFLKRCPDLAWVYGFEPREDLLARRQRRRHGGAEAGGGTGVLSVPGIVSALQQVLRLQGVETSNIFILQAVLSYLPTIKILGRFRNRNGRFPVPEENRISLTHNPLIVHLNLTGVILPALPRMDYLKYLSLKWVRFTDPHPFRDFQAKALRTFVMRHCAGPTNPIKFVQLITALAGARGLSRLELVRANCLGGMLQHVVEVSWRTAGFRMLQKVLLGACKHMLEMDLGYLAITASNKLEELAVQASLTKDSFFSSLTLADVQFPFLETLYLGYVDDFPPPGRWSLETLTGFGLPEVSECPANITDVGMKAAGTVFRQLKSLTVFNAPHLHAPTTWLIPGQNSLSLLKELHLRRCHAIRLSNFCALLPLLPHLETLHLEQMFREPPKGCSRVGLSAGTGLGVASALVANAGIDAGNLNNGAPGAPAGGAAPNQNIDDDDMDQILVDVDVMDIEMALPDELAENVAGQPAAEPVVEPVEGPVAEPAAESADNVPASGVSEPISSSNVRTGTSSDLGRNPAAIDDSAIEESNSDAYPDAEVYVDYSGNLPGCSRTRDGAAGRMKSPTEIARIAPDVIATIAPDVVSTASKALESNPSVPVPACSLEGENTNGSGSWGMDPDEHEPECPTDEGVDWYEEPMDIEGVRHQVAVAPENSIGGVASDGNIAQGGGQAAKEWSDVSAKSGLYDRSRADVMLASDQNSGGIRDSGRLLVSPDASVMTSNIDSNRRSSRTVASSRELRSNSSPSYAAASPGMSLSNSASQSLNRVEPSPLNPSPSARGPADNHAITRFNGLRSATVSSSRLRVRKTVSVEQSIGRSSTEKAASADACTPCSAEPPPGKGKSLLGRKKGLVKRSATSAAGSSQRPQRVSRWCQALVEDIRESTKRARQEGAGAGCTPGCCAASSIAKPTNDAESKTSDGGGVNPDVAVQCCGPPEYFEEAVGQEVRGGERGASVDRATSTSDPVLEEDCKQVLTIVSASLVNITLHQVGITELVVHTCPNLQMINGSACRVLTTVRLLRAPKLQQVSFVQCQKLHSKELVDAVCSLPPERSRFVFLRPLKNYEEREMAALMFRSTAYKYHLGLVHDNLAPGRIMPNRLRAAAWIEVVTNVNYELLQREDFVRAETQPALKASYPWRRNLHTTHGYACEPEGSSWTMTSDLPWIQTLRVAPPRPDLRGRVVPDGLYNPSAMGHLQSQTCFRLLEQDIAEASESRLPLYSHCVMVYVNTCDVGGTPTHDPYI